MNTIKNPNLLLNLFDRPKIIGVTGDRNGGKSNLLYWLILALKESSDFDLYTYGLRANLSKYGERKIYSTKEMEQVHDAVLFMDEFPTVLDVEDRKQKKEIEDTLRLINHNNVILVLSGLGHNYNKFLSGMLDSVIYTYCSIQDFINGSNVKNIAREYHGQWRGSRVLSISKGYALVWDGKNYDEVAIPLVKEFDTKANNEPIFKDKETIKRGK
jgi:hypothetical protein